MFASFTYNLIDYKPIFPWQVSPLILVFGLFCLWSTRATSDFYSRFGRKYLVFSAIIRPLGILAISMAWADIIFTTNFGNIDLRYLLDTEWAAIIDILLLVIVTLAIYIIGFVDSFLRPFAIYYFLISIMLWVGASERNPEFGDVIDYDGLLIPFVYLSAIILATFWEFYAIYSLGLRRSFLYARPDDPLIADGPYRYQRHPQLLTACILIFSSWMAIPGDYWVEEPTFSQVIRPAYQAINLIIAITGLWLITRLEEKDLIKRFGDSYLEYRKKVPGFIRCRPGKRGLGWLNSLGLTIVSLTISFCYAIYSWPPDDLQFLKNIALKAIHSCKMLVW